MLSNNVRMLGPGAKVTAIADGNVIRLMIFDGQEDAFIEMYALQAEELLEDLQEEVKRVNREPYYRPERTFQPRGVSTLDNPAIKKKQ